jgi:5-(carboxyamino)imidazole ribonucleotide mutase
MAEPLVGIVIGSSSDLAVMKKAGVQLKEFGIPFEERIISAHRVPEEVNKYASTAAQRGLEVIIAGAGKAAHLAGAVASRTALPVIGVPLSSQDLQGMDSLLSTVQMPSGVPVATVAIDGAKNAAILAAQILGVKYPELRGKIEKFKQKMAQKYMNKS